MAANSMTRVALFIDGGYWCAVQAFHRRCPGRPGPHSLASLLSFVTSTVAGLEQIPPSDCIITEKHYFRGYLGTDLLEERGKLRQQSLLHDELLSLGIQPHFWPMPGGQHEKGVDVALALEAYKAVAERHADLVVLVAGDGDYVPLVQQIRCRDGRVVVLAWDFDYTDRLGERRNSRVSAALVRESWRRVQVDQYREPVAPVIEPACIVETRNQTAGGSAATPRPECGVEPLDGTEVQGIDITADLLSGLGGRGTRTGQIQSLHEDSYGFIRDSAGISTNWFFHRRGLIGVAYEDLQVGADVEFGIGYNHQGPIAEGVSLRTA